MQHFVNNQIFQPSVLASHPACWFNDLPQRPTQPFLLFCFYHWGRLSLFGCININPFRNRCEFYCICSRSDIGQDEGRGGGVIQGHGMGVICDLHYIHWCSYTQQIYSIEDFLPHITLTSTSSRKQTWVHGITRPTNKQNVLRFDIRQ